MFSTLETTWDRSARRGWSTLASLTFQAMAVSLLLLVPLFTVQGPPKWEWLRPLVAPTREAPVTPPPEQQAQQASNVAYSNMQGIHLIAPPRVPPHAVQITDVGPPPQFALNGSDRSGVNIPGAIFGDRDSAILPVLHVKTAAVKAREFKTSTWAEGNLVHKVQPSYPEIARLAGIHGAVQLHAVISKNGTIENLIVENGHPMLVKAAIEAVRQWRYRPYLLNNEPVEIETEITVNFVLGGS